MASVSATARRPLSKVTVISILGLTLLVVGGAETVALQARQREEVPHQKIDGSACVKCHSDAKMLAKLRAKEGATHFLFNPDGTLRDPKAAELVRSYNAQASYHQGISSPIKNDSNTPKW